MIDNLYLYAIAKQVVLDAGLPWTDPRTGRITKPDRKKKRKKRRLAYRGGQG